MFAAEQFEKHEYAFALHHESERDGEPPHPHVQMHRHAATTSRSEH